MPIKNNLSDLPRDEGWPPDENQHLVNALMREWDLLHPNDGRAMSVEGRLWRASWAGTCRRSLHYNVTRQPVTNPPTVADRWRMNTGQLVHDELDAMAVAFAAQLEAKAEDGVEPTKVLVEHKVDLRPAGIDGAATADLVIMKANGSTTVVECKSVVGFKFKQKATKFNGPPKGPDLSHIIQAAVTAKALDADRVIVLYLALENVSPSLAYRASDDGLGRMAAQWTLSRGMYEPIAEAEIARVNEVLATVEAGVLAERLVPNDDGVERLIVNPAKGLWNDVADDGRILDSGKAWQCDYCDFRDRCIVDGTEGTFVDLRDES